MKIAYFGLPLGALLLLRDGHELAPVVLSPVDAPGRRRLRRLGISFIDTLPRAVGANNAVGGGAGAPPTHEIEHELARAKPELLVSWFWTRKLPARWLTSPPGGAIGVHPSLLPRHRGPNPYFWTIDAGDEVAGVTVHRLNADYDTGAMLERASLEVGGRDAWQLARALDRPSLSLLRATIAHLARGEPLTEEKQDETLATWAPEPDGQALRVDFGWTTERVLRRIRALSPTPGLALEVEGVPLFVTRAERADVFVSALLPGEAQLSEALLLRTSDGALRVVSAYFPDQDVSASTSAEVMEALRGGARGARSRGV